MKHQTASCQLESLSTQQSNKMDELYEQFAVLKKRIDISEKRRQKSSHKYYQSPRSHFQRVPSNSRKISTYNDNIFVSPQVSSFNLKDSSDLNETKALLKNGIKKLMQDHLNLAQIKVKTKIARLESKLAGIHQLLPGILKVMRMNMSAKSKRESRSSSKQCGNCKKKETEVNELNQLPMRHRQEMRKLTETYENRISILMNEIKDMATTSSSSKDKSPWKEYEHQLRKLQEKMFLKQQELTDCQISNSQLRQANDHTQKLLGKKDKLTIELQNQIQSKISEVQKLRQELASSSSQTVYPQRGANNMKFQKVSMEEVKQEPHSRVTIAQIEERNTQLAKIQLFQQMRIKQLNEHMRSLQKAANEKLAQNTKLIKQVNEMRQKCKKVKELEDQNQALKLKLQEVLKQKKQLVNPKHDSVDLDAVAIEVKHNHLQIEGDAVEGLQRQGFAQIHSYTTLPRQKRIIKTQFCLKKLSAQLGLAVQQNRRLKMKKDFIQSQVKGSQHDEQKFQTQCQVLKDQIKRVHYNMRTLDECAINLLKGTQIQIQKIQTLDSDLKFPRQYRKHVKPKAQQKKMLK